MGKRCQEQVHGLVLPLLLQAVGGEKMGKSAGNAIWLDPAMTSPLEMYQVGDEARIGGILCCQYLIGLSDEDAKLALRMLSLEEAEKVLLAILDKPGLVQTQIAREITSIVHSRKVKVEKFNFLQRILLKAAGKFQKCFMSETEKLFLNGSAHTPLNACTLQRHQEKRKMW